MIISASRRTDIPAFYADWFFHRLSEGYVMTRNPMNPAMEKRISLLPGDVGGIVFWSKNPAPMLGRLDALARHRFYFQFTLTPYGRDVEPGLPGKAEIAGTFRRLSDALGPERVIWRYDPILINPVYTPEFHTDAFARLAAALGGYTRRCVISFVDLYRNTRANAESLRLIDMDDEAKRSLARAFSTAAAGQGISIAACAEELDLADAGVGRARCVDVGLFNALWGVNLSSRKAPGQRKACGCAESVDIGAYNTCSGGCLYCYANYNAALVRKRAASHIPGDPFI